MCIAPGEARGQGMEKHSIAARLNEHQERTELKL